MFCILYVVFMGVPVSGRPKFNNDEDVVEATLTYEKENEINIKKVTQLFG